MELFNYKVRSLLLIEITKAMIKLHVNCILYSCFFNTSTFFVEPKRLFVKQIVLFVNMIF